jgi:hypothetical protein
MAEPMVHNPIPAGTLVRVEQRIIHGTDEWPTTVEGEVISHQLEPTGSWYAHGKKDKLWLARLRLKKADGEITALNLDSNSTITILKHPT